MGMDVYGKNPSSEKGKYFRNNVWSWHPLADYCAAVAPKIWGKIKYAHTNDSDGLNAKDSKELAKALRAELSEGRTAQYAIERAAALEALPDEVCKTCGGTGKRGKEPCNGCASFDGSFGGKPGLGKVRPFETWYRFDATNVAEFADFLADCGGFEIC